MPSIVPSASPDSVPARLGYFELHHTNVGLPARYSDYKRRWRGIPARRAEVERRTTALVGAACVAAARLIVVVGRNYFYVVRCATCTPFVSRSRGEAALDALVSEQSLRLNYAMQSPQFVSMTMRRCDGTTVVEAIVASGEGCCICVSGRAASTNPSIATARALGSLVVIA